VTEATELENVDKLPGSLWERLRAEPERAPEIISLAAADRFGPQAERWIASAGPGHVPASLARTAVKKHVRLARVEGAAFGVGGVVTTAPDIVALYWLQSRMIFYVAAAMGYDPRHPMRPAELLALQGVYSTPQAAREGLDGVGQSMAAALVSSKLSKGRDEQIAAKLLKYAGKRMAKRYAGRLVPFIGAPIGAVQNAGATKELGQRTLSFYGAA
jgi:hypothetical protein